MDKIAKIQKLLNEAQKELNKFKTSNNEVFLYQASEKVWMSYVLLIELMTKKELGSRKEIGLYSWKLIGKSMILRDLYYKANVLHQYHYEGRLDTKFVVEHINYCLKYIRMYLEK